MNVLVPRPPITSEPLRITSEHGLAGIDQVVQLPRIPARVRVRGRILSGAAQLVVGWSEGGEVREVESALHLRRGSETHRISLPAGKGPLAVMVGVVQLMRGGVLELTRIELASGGRQYLRNAALSFDLCPPLPERPEAAFASPVWLRWPATFLLLALVAFVIGGGASTGASKEGVLELDRVEPERGGSQLPQGGPSFDAAPSRPQRSDAGIALSRPRRLLSLLFLTLVAAGLRRASSPRSRRR